MKQHHSHLAVSSGSFTDRESHWSKYDREDFSVVHEFMWLDYMLACKTTTRIFTDHVNLLIFIPVTMEPSLVRHKVLKVVCCALFLSALTYKI